MSRTGKLLSALVSGKRNVTAAWAAASFGLPPLAEGYVAACVIPVLALALIANLGAALFSHAGRLWALARSRRGNPGRRMGAGTSAATSATGRRSSACSASEFLIDC